MHYYTTNYVSHSCQNSEVIHILDYLTPAGGCLPLRGIQTVNA